MFIDMWGFRLDDPEFAITIGQRQSDLHSVVDG